MKKYVFEVSFEVCNKLGGIHTVITSKLAHALKNYGDAYIAIGPDLAHNREFEECEHKSFEQIKPFLAENGLRCRFGRWQTAGKPLTILVSDYKNRYNIDRLLFTFWEQFGVDSYGATSKYVESMMFATCAAEVIEAAAKAFHCRDTGVAAHFHEWSCGAGVLYLKKNAPRVGTVITTHSTVLGRALAQENPYYIQELEDSNVVLDEKAREFAVKPQHSLEIKSTQQADCFTTVSEFTANEAYLVLDRQPDLAVYNGLNLESLSTADKTHASENKTKLLKTLSEFFGESLPSNTKIWLTSGRNEYLNKGFNLTLESLAEFTRQANFDKKQPIVFLCLVANKYESYPNHTWFRPADPNYRPINITPVSNPDHDQIINTIKYHGLDKKSNPLKVAYSSVYLNGQDGIFNLKYKEVLACADLTIFPSLYEPWGYTPLESAIRGIPTVTTNLTGFGNWAGTLAEDLSGLINIIDRRNQKFDISKNDIVEIMHKDYNNQQNNKEELLKKAELLKTRVSWDDLYEGYSKAYDIALAKSFNRSFADRYEYNSKNPFKEESTVDENEYPDLNFFNFNIPLPERISALNELANNMYWTWSFKAKDMFSYINSDLWNYFNNNPIKLLRSISYSRFKDLSEDQTFLALYDEAINDFREYMVVCPERAIIDKSKEHIAYFSMEYGLHESIPTYAGGLGILSGDHIKAASDLNLNMVALGLYYHNGYFMQEINHEGMQVEHFTYHDWKNLPIKVLMNQAGESIKIPVEFPGRIVWAKVLVCQVGRVSLFLFDTNIIQNKVEDRQITARLYESDRKLRISQEIIVATAGMTLLKDVLKLNTSVYHLNEGHCAFIAVEYLRREVAKGINFQAALENLKSKTVFTTHTPVAAGNEAFSNDLMHDMFYHQFQKINLPFDHFMSLGYQDRDPYNFSMTVLALKISSKANAVSKLHGEVSKEMWKNTLDQDAELEMTYVTNGVHWGTWLGKEIKKISKNKVDFKELASNIDQVNDQDLWQAHLTQKATFIEHLKSQVTEEYSRKGVNPEIIKNITDKLNPKHMIIGFARRFAEYKRAGLIFKDHQILDQILNNVDEPVTLVFAGKAHPANNRGKELIQEIYQHVINEKFTGQVILLEDYNMKLGHLMTTGSDLWLNNPKFRLEACGTSGMKAAMNGVLNLSIPDGWWAEAYNPDIGWSITPSKNPDNEQADHEESQLMYQLLKNQIVSKYYYRGKDGDQDYSKEWLTMMRASIKQISQEFSAKKMLENYNEKLYLPTAKKLQEIVS